MAVTLEIPMDRWDSVLNAFSNRNQGRPVRLEVTIPPGEGEPLIAEGRPLLGVGFDRKGSDAPAIVVTIGGMQPGEPDLRHVIEQPNRIWVEEELDGLGVALEVKSWDEGYTRVVFVPERALPEEDEETEPAVR